jgi:phosphatidylserine/phosphatidylglycerophosphate/cardiolipin synthase-like enzyme
MAEAARLVYSPGVPVPRTHQADRIITAPGERRDAIFDVLRGARRQLLVSLFRCNDSGVFDELAAAVERGVAVDVLTTGRAKGRKKLQKLWDALGRTGANIHTYPDPVVKYHAKYLVADDGPAVVASLNFTKKCFTRTSDAIVITYDPAVVSGLRLLLEADREGHPVPDRVTERLIIGPERARRQFSDLVVNARERIRLIDPKLSDPDLLTLLNERRAAGVRVDIVGGKRIGDLKSHGKMMLVDGRLAVVGSLALAAVSLDFRREVAITVQEPAAVGEIERFFDFATEATIDPDDLPGEEGEALC